MNWRTQGTRPLLMGAGALVVLAGCTYAPLQKASAPSAKVEPLYRVQQPAGTAAGQYAVGRMELAAGRVDAAVRRFQQALQLDPALVEAHNGLGIAYGQQGRFVDAADAFRGALAHAPDAPHLLNNLGYALMRAGSLDDAWVALSRAYRLDTANPQTRENLVQLAAARKGATTPVAAAIAPSDPATETHAAAGSATLSSSAVQVPATRSTDAIPPASVAVKPVASPVVSIPGLHGAVIVQSDESRLRQVAPGILELRPASEPTPQVAASARVIMPPTAKVDAPPAARLASAAGAASPVNGFEVSNGVGVRHVAGRMARALARLGVSVDRVSDYRWFGVRRSEIHYRDGHRDAAMTVAGTLPVQPRVLRSTRMQQSINVRLVVGRDLNAKQLAWLGEESLLQADLADGTAPSAQPAAQAASDEGRVLQIASAQFSRGWRHF